MTCYRHCETVVTTGIQLNTVARALRLITLIRTEARYWVSRTLVRNVKGTRSIGTVLCAST
jgi:hypothetical protein